MQRKGLAFSQIYDVRAVRVLVPEMRDCYTADVVFSDPVFGELRGQNAAEITSVDATRPWAVIPRHRSTPPAHRRWFQYCPAPWLLFWCATGSLADP